MSKRRSAIAENPLDLYVGPKAAADASSRGLEAKAPRKPEKAAESPRKPEKVRATFHISSDLLDGLRDAVVALSGPPLRLTLADLAETALRHELERLQKKHNGGEPFARRGGELRGGRPIKG